MRALQSIALTAVLLMSCATSEAEPPTASHAPEAPRPVEAVAPLAAPTLAWSEPEQLPERAPITLTASDGTGLDMRALTVRSVVQEPLAYTELHLVFENPQDRVIEGRFEITLPSGAAISRFAMKIDDQWQEGEVVEKQRARRAFEDALHRRVDPALLEKKAGNQFRARVFPIPARGRKHIIIAYSEELTSGAKPYEVQLSGLSQLESFEADISVDRGGEPTRLRQTNADFLPTGNLAIDLGNESVGLRAGDMAITRVRPHFEVERAPMSGLTVLLDTSASRAPGFRSQVSRLASHLQAVIAEQGDIPVQVLGFDQEVHPFYEGRASGFGEAVQAQILARGALGASNPQAALAYLADHGSQPRVLFVSDGIATAGESEAVELRAAVASLSAVGVTRLDALVDGGIRDEALLSELTRAGLPQDGVVIEAASPSKRVAERLSKSTLSGLRVEVPGADWVWPATVDGLQPGDEVVVYARLPEQHPVQVHLGGQATPMASLATVARPLVERAMAQAEITALTQLEAQEEDADKRLALAERITTLSTAHRVLSEHTALLVLETEADYARFEIDRKALAQILVVENGGLTLQSREGVVRPGLRRNAPPGPDASIASKTAATTFPHEGDMAAVTEASPSLDGAGSGEMFDQDAPMSAADAIEAASADAPPMEDMEAPVAVTRARNERPSAPPPRVARQSVPRTGFASGAAAVQSEAADERAPADLRQRRTAAKMDSSQAWNGRFQQVMQQIKRRDLTTALELALSWRDEDPGDVLALVALGEVYEAMSRPEEAARAYGAIIDLFPSRADMRRMAGERLERLGSVGLPLAVDTFEEAVAQRPDHPASHRLLAFALEKQGEHQRAFEAAVAGATRSYPGGRFAGVSQILREDVGLLAASWSYAEPLRAREIHDLSDQAGGTWPTGRSVRFVLNWETDANDVDFHILDAQGGHAYYGNKSLDSGGYLYADVTTGYGPECFTIHQPKAYPYTLQAHYYSRGPMGYGMGKLQVIDYDGKGHLSFDERPFIVMTDGAYVDLGTVTRTPKSVAAL